MASRQMGKPPGPGEHARHHTAVVLSARGCTDSPGDCGPEGLPRTWKPAQTGVGLNLESGVVVVLELGSDRQIQLFRNEFNFILSKRAEKAVAPTGKDSARPWLGCHVVTGQPVASSPDEVVPPPERDLVLEIKVNRVTLFFDDDVVTVRPVVVHLEA